MSSHCYVLKDSEGRLISFYLTYFDCGGIPTFQKEANSKVKIMCPLCIILVFLSGLVVGYFTWKTFCTQADEAQGPLIKVVQIQKMQPHTNQVSSKRLLQQLFQDFGNLCIWQVEDTCGRTWSLTSTNQITSFYLLLGERFSNASGMSRRLSWHQDHGKEALTVSYCARRSQSKECSRLCGMIEVLHANHELKSPGSFVTQQ